MLQVAYLTSLGLWLPLAVIGVLKPALLRRVMAPLAASAIAACYEAYMSFVWSPTVFNPIRVDALFVLAALAAVDALVGFGLWVGSARRTDRGALRAAATLCLAVPALALAGFATMAGMTANLDRQLASARRFRFEAYFRDDVTEKRVFGVLRPDRNPWAGYYAATGADDRIAHLVVNDEGRFWIYSKSLYERSGSGRNGATGDFEGAGEGRLDARTRITLRREAGGSFLLDVNDSNPALPPNQPFPMRKADPPRFPHPSTAGDTVRFAGVFSATYGEMNGGVWVTQVWLWESGGDWWGRYIRDSYQHGSVAEFVSTESIVPSCSDQCRVLSFTTSRGPVTLTRLSNDELTATMRGEYKQVMLKRGETIPGFFLDLAPLATRSENRQWIEAVTAAGMISWNVP
jgi:hypothetical protein